MKTLIMAAFLSIIMCPVKAIANPDSNNPIFPQQLTAQKLLTYCASSSLTDVGRMRQRYCWGFISGVEEATRLTALISNQSTGKTICAPEGITSRKLAKAYIQYAGQKGTELTQPAAQMVAKALAKTYPCSD